MFIPVWLLVVSLCLMAGFVAWALLAANARNPLPFPDNGSRIFAAATPEGKAAVVALLARHGLRQRFRFDSSGIERAILWDGTIINHSPDDVLDTLGQPSASIGLVAHDPVASAHAAVAFLQSQGFEARVVLNAEPNLPIAFVVTNALRGTVINFRRHVTRLPRPQAV